MSFSAFAGGVLNPLTIPAHLLTLVGVGLLIGAQPGGRLITALCFAAGLAAGLAAIAHAVGSTPALDVLLILSGISGALVALAIALPQMLAALVAALAGLALSLDSPPQAISLADATTALIGTWLSAVLAFVCVVVTAAHLTRDWPRIGLRIVGSWIAASAILVLALRFARGILFAM